MSFSKISALAGVLSLASTVAAHGHVTGLTVDGTFIGGWELAYGYTATPPAVPGWTTKALDNGFVAPSLFGTSDIACHLGATAGQAYATVAAGSSVDVKWDTWPESHHGPVIDALASCGDDCTTATAGSLEFFVIAKKGLVDGSSAPGVWASDELMANGNTWSVTIPASIAPGKYVLRHEIIALHGAGAADGAQNYPQCLNLEVTGSGTLKPAGVTADKFYTPTDPGILVSIYAPLGDSYVIPGPAVFSGGDAAPAPAPTSDAAPVASASATVAPIATSPSEEYPTVTAAPTVISPPYTNGTIPSSTKSACKSKSKTTAAAPLPTSTTPDEEYPSEDPATPVVTVVPTPLATGTPSSPTSPSTPVDSTPSEALPTGTKLSSVLAWISSFYTANKDTVYTGASTLKKRSHARAMRL